MSKNNRKDPEPSEAFKKIVRSGGTAIADCELCGRTHFAPETDLDYEDSEFDLLKQKAEAEPDKYIADYTVDDITIGRIDGQQVVIDCPCNKLSRYERFIWNQRRIIAEYYKARIKEMADDLEEEIERFGDLLEDGSKFQELLEQVEIRKLGERKIRNER